MADLNDASLKDLSQELILRILSFLDIPSVLRVGAADRELYEFPNLADVWMTRCEQLWPAEPRLTLVKQDYLLHCRTQLLARARARCDGVYVARCVYARRVQEGASMTDNRTYLQIVYHRLIRFLPDKTALMLLSEKGSRGSIRAAFNELVLAEKAPESFEKYGKQLIKCRWRVLSEDEDGAIIAVTYFDGKLCWSAKLQACHGSGKRQPGGRLMWKEYKFWDPSEVAEYRRRELYRERERVSNRLRLADLNGTDMESISDMLYQMEQLADAMRSVREVLDDDVDHIPEELAKDLKLWPEHFPTLRFGHNSTLAHLF